MTAASLLPGDIILWDGCPALVEATVASNAPGYVKVKLHCSPVIFLWQGEMEVLAIGNIQDFEFYREVLTLPQIRSYQEQHDAPLLLSELWHSIAA